MIDIYGRGMFPEHEEQFRAIEAALGFKLFIRKHGTAAFCGGLSSSWTKPGYPRGKFSLTRGRDRNTQAIRRTRTRSGKGNKRGWRIATPLGEQQMNIINDNAGLR